MNHSPIATMTDEQAAFWLEVLEDDIEAVLDLFPAAPDEDAKTRRKRMAAVHRTLKQSHDWRRRAGDPGIDFIEAALVYRAVSDAVDDVVNEEVAAGRAVWVGPKHFKVLQPRPRTEAHLARVTSTQGGVPSLFAELDAD